MTHSEKQPEAKVLSRLAQLRLAGTRALLNIDAEGCAVAPGERPVAEIVNMGGNLLRTSWGVADGDKLGRRIAPIDVPPLPPEPVAKRGSDEEKVRRYGGRFIRRLRPNEAAEYFAVVGELAPLARDALRGQWRARRGGAYRRAVMEVVAVGQGAIRKRPWSIPAGDLSTAVNPKNRWAISHLQAGKAPPGWARI